MPKVLEQDGHVWHLFVIRTSKRNELQKYLSENGVQTLIHYQIHPHKQKAYKEYNTLSFPLTEQMHEEVLSLPLSGVICEGHTEKIVAIINEY